MIETLVHRGPDDRGVELGDGWALGMTRLAIQDLSHAGHQPMSRGDLTIVFNGEVYNFAALREELRQLGYEFVSGSDTEVVLHALRAWGPAALNRFNGMFALAVVDRGRRSVLLARDRFGKKPLFIARLGQRVLFASELKALMAVARQELTLSNEGLASFFRFLYVPAPRTIFTEVEKLPPASWVELDLDRPTAQRASQQFWRLPVASGRGQGSDPEHLLEVLRDAVRRRLVADVPVGAFLSGGIDSSLVVASMREVASDVRSFSIGFEDPRYDESVYACRVAKHLDTRHTNQVLTEAEAIRLVTDLPTVYDEPFADSSAIPTIAVARLARRHVTVALSGDGGDELFGGYTRYQVRPHAHLAGRIPRALARRISDSARIRDRHARMSAHAGAQTFGDGYQEVLATWRRSELRQLMPEATPSDSVRAAVDGAHGRFVERMMRADAETYLVDDILQKVDRATMTTSLEARNPLLDPDVVEVAMGAVALAERAPGTKQLLRAALMRQLPTELVDRPKKGFTAPVREWLRTDLRPLVEDLVIARTDAEYDISYAQRICREFLAGREVVSSKVWSLVALELWRQRWWT